MTKKFKSLLTDKGKALIADAIAGGKAINLKYLAVGDGNGSEVTPSAAQTALVNEVARLELNSIKESDTAGQIVTAEAIIPADIGGFWIREAGIFTDDGVLVAVSQMPAAYKADASEGAASTLSVRMMLAVSDVSAITITVDDSIVLATELFVKEAIKTHEKSRNHPDATTAAKGFVQLSSATNSTSEAQAATPKAVKVVNDNANSRLAKDQNLADLTDVKAAVKNLGLDNIDSKYTHSWRIGEPGAGVHYTKLAEVWYKEEDKSSSVTLLVSGANYSGDGPRQTDIVTCTYNHAPNTLTVEHLVIRDAASADTRATYGYTLNGTAKVDIWLIHPDYSGDTAVSVISGKSDHITLFTDAEPTAEAPTSLHEMTPSFVWSDKHKATASDVDAVSASEGGTFGGVVTVTDELNTVATPGTDANDGDYLNGGFLRSFLQGRGANGDTRGAYAGLYIQEHVGSEHKAILNINGFGKDLNWTFNSDSSFNSPGIITEAGQRVYSPNNPPPVNNAGAVTSVRLSGLTWAGKIGNDAHNWGDGMVITAVQSHENYAINMEFGLRTIQVLIDGQWLNIGSI